MHLVLQPCGNSDARRHFRDTVARPVALDRIVPFLGEPERQLVRATFGSAVAVWGVTAGKGNVNAAKWHRMALGDRAMFYRDKTFFHTGTVAYKTHSPELARALWGIQPDGSTWEHVFFLSDLESIEIDIATFNAAAGYVPHYVVQGFNILAEDLSERIMDFLDIEGGAGAFISEPADIATAKVALAALAGNLNISRAHQSRAEQRLLRTILLGNRSTEQCALCHRNLPVDLLVIGHIRKRHSCSDDQKKDLNNVMPVCLLGCDRLFENGYVHVDGAGNVRVRADAGLPESLQVHLDLMDHRPCLAWHPGSAPYFDWHRRGIAGGANLSGSPPN